jgi:hypothetical protein
MDRHTACGLIDVQFQSNSTKEAVTWSYVANGKIKHDALAKYLALTRFPFPDQNINPKVWGQTGFWPDDYVTIVNADKKQRAIQFRGKAWYPDIVVVNGKNEVRELCEVEMEEDISPGILEKWRGYAAAATTGPRGYPKLFLYVPASKLTEAKEILDEGNVRYAGLRTYEMSDDLYTVKMNIVVTYDP